MSYTAENDIVSPFKHQKVNMLAKTQKDNAIN